MLKRRWPIILLSPLVLILAWISLCEVFCPTGTFFEFKCRYLVSIGISLEKAESILGPAEEIGSPPYLMGSGPAVSGDRYFMWEGEAAELYVGVRDGKICSKWIWIPSL